MRSDTSFIYGKKCGCWDEALKVAYQTYGFIYFTKY